MLVAIDEGEVQATVEEKASATPRRLFGANLPEISTLKQSEKEKKNSSRP